MAARTWMGLRIPASLILGCLFLADLASAPAVAAAAPRPHIVVIYMDDFSPAAARLWSQRSRAPALARFVDYGISLRASGSTLSAARGRADLLTGRYGHRTGVTGNRLNAFDPRGTVAVSLRNAGCHTAFVGKFLDGLRDLAPSDRRMRTYAQGWDDFDVLWENQGAYHDYRIWTREGSRRFGRGPDDHSSHVMGLRAVRRIAEAPRRKPLFMVVSLYDGHPPLTPMATFRGHPACRGVAPFRDPSFNEADVSDKPGYVRRRPRVRRAGSSLQRRCAAIVSVNWSPSASGRRSYERVGWTTRCSSSRPTTGR